MEQLQSATSVAGFFIQTFFLYPTARKAFGAALLGGPAYGRQGFSRSPTPVGVNRRELRTFSALAEK